MTKDTITQVVLKADEGFYLTNGDTCAKTVVLPESADTTVWEEITNEEYEEKQKEIEESGVDTDV